MKALIITILLASSSGVGQNRIEEGTAEGTADPDFSVIRLEAFEVLESRCNSCHIERNPRKVFSLENMASYSSKIYKQVFVKKRMPKGKDNQLSHQESQKLTDWIKGISNN